jgi:succinate-semialdehyde dehydrogenase/glutarate-semialdehyde dehydrogenase
VHRRAREGFTDRVLDGTKAVRLGDPLDPDTTMGPLNNEPTAAKVDRHLDAARAGGARILAGGGRVRDFPTPLFYAPTVLDGVTPDSMIATEETFGPVVPIVEIASDEEALALTNGSPYGLQAAVFTTDLARGLRFAERARTGWVNVNASTNYWESHLPFGGRSGSASGRGKVGGRSVLDAFTEPKTITFNL